MKKKIALFFAFLLLAVVFMAQQSLVKLESTKTWTKSITSYSDQSDYKEVKTTKSKIFEKNDTVNASDNYYALLIGVDEYVDTSINSLNQSIEYAEQLYTILTHNYIFEPENIKLLKNPTKLEIIRAFDFFVDSLKSNDNLLIFYAGFGYWDENNELCYWLPSDIQKHNTSNWLQNELIQTYIATIPTLHTLLISDICFNGGIFIKHKAFDYSSKELSEIYALSSRTAMIGGLLNELPDESMFLKYLYKRLQQNKQKYLTAKSLFFSFNEAVLNCSEHIPQYNVIRNTGDEGGDFVFIKRDEAE